MKNLQEYIKESLLDVEGTIKANDEAIRRTIEKWINDNFKVTDLKISDITNSDGLYEVDAKNVIVKNKNITSLTNDLFIWNKIKNDFSCSCCASLKSLEGAPKKVGRDFYCNDCASLKSLEGAPKEVRLDFHCNDCASLKSLEGAPEEVGGDFYCYNCKSLKSADIPAITKIKGDILK